MDIDPPELAGVRLNTFEPNGSTPQVDDYSWRGVLIAAPTRVAYYETEPLVIPICGYSMLDVIVDPSEPHRPLTLYVESEGERYEGLVVALDDSPLVPKPDDDDPFDPEELEGLAVAGYFNCDAVAICNLPKLAGNITVWAETNGMASPPLTVLLEVKQPEP